MRKIVLAVALSIAGAVALPVPVLAMSTYYTAQGCSGCHGASPTTCNGCHHHGGSPSISGAQASYAPGATISVTINGGSQSGWVRGAILDASNKVLAITSKTAYPVTVTTTAPTTPGTYTWKGAWYGNGYDSGGVIGGGSSTFVADPSNPNHGFEPRSFTFTVAAPAAPSASLSATSLAFGNVTVGTTKSLATVSVKNTGSASLGVTSVTPCSNTQPPFSISPAAAFTVAAGGSQALTVGFAPTSSGSFTGCYTLATNDAAHPTLTLNVTGTGTAVAAPSATLTPASLSFGSVTVGQTSTLTATVGNTGSAALSVTGVTTCDSSTSPALTVTPTAAFTVAAGGSQALSVKFAPTAAGAVSGCWNVATNDPAHATLQLRATGTGAAVVATAPVATLAPAALAFGSVTVGQTKTMTASVGNTGNASLSVTGVTACASSAAAFTVTPTAAFTVAAGGAQALSVKFAPTAAGTFAGCWTIATNDPAHATLQLTASATGAAATVTDGATLYATYCASCHGALATSSKRGATATQIQGAINNNTGGMGSLSSLTSTQVQAIATALGGGTTTPPPPPPPTTGGCTSCHAAPPNTGRHVMHVQEEHLSCAACHGYGYDALKQTVNTTTHRDGKVELRSSLRWSSASRTCAPACHGQKSWSYVSGGGDDDGEDHEGARGDDIAVVDDGSASNAGGCASTGVGFTVMVFLGLALSRLVRRGARA